MSDYEFSKVEKDGHITIVTINRPDRMNALHPPANFELEKIFNDFAEDPDQWVAIITGAGDKGFSAGNDLRWQAEGNKIDRFLKHFAKEIDEYLKEFGDKFFN